MIFHSIWYLEGDGGGYFRTIIHSLHFKTTVHQKSEITRIYASKLKTFLFPVPFILKVCMIPVYVLTTVQSMSDSEPTSVTLLLQKNELLN